MHTCYKSYINFVHSILQQYDFLNRFHLLLNLGLNRKKISNTINRICNTIQIECDKKFWLIYTKIYYIQCNFSSYWKSMSNSAIWFLSFVIFPTRTQTHTHAHQYQLITTDTIKSDVCLLYHLFSSLQPVRNVYAIHSDGKEIALAHIEYNDVEKVKIRFSVRLIAMLSCQNEHGSQ